MAAEPPAIRGSTVTFDAVIGRNVRLARESRGWDRERLAEEAEFLDIDWDVAAIAAIEQGTRDLTVSDLISLAVILGIAPHLLMYPEPGTVVALWTAPPDSAADAAALEVAILAAETHFAAADFANWIWDPNGHPFTHTDVSERDLWAAADSSRES